MEITYEILLEFQNITSYDIAAFFKIALSFFNGDYNKIVAYYSGNINTISSDPFNNFSLLKQQRDSVFEIVNSHKKKLTNLKWFLLVEKIEDIDSRLRTLDNINKWSRSSITKVAYDPSFQMPYRLKQKETLEKISQDVLGSNNAEDDWVQIALDNAIREEDYSPAGGTNMNLKLKRSAGFNFKINSVVDIMNGKSVYGKDLDRFFGFDTPNNDLKILGYDDTLQQAIYTLIRLRKNDIPSNKKLGLQQSVAIGTNRALLNFPIITRQLSTTFAADDSLKDFSVNQYTINQDNLTVNFSVKSRLGEVIGNQTANI